VRFGLEAGTNVNHVTFSKDILSSENKMGFFVGPKLYFTLPIVGLGIDVSALYSRKTATIISNSWGTVANSNDLNYIEVPLNLRWNIGSENIGVYLATGPQYDWFIGDRTFRDIYNNYSTVFEQNVLTWNVGGGIMLLKHIQVGVTYNLPITNAGSISDTVSQSLDSENLKHHSWQVRLNYFF